jgi:hypothetical protein
MADVLALTPDDYARAILLEVVPRGYRLVDPSDERLAVVHAHCLRVAMRHVGPTPTLFGICGPGGNAREAARLGAEFAARTFVPTAIQRRVRPGVVMVALGTGAELPAAGPVDGTPVPAVVWTLDTAGGRLSARGRVPGAPPAGSIKRAIDRLLRGAAPPTIGAIDVAERNLMYGRGGRRYTTGGTVLSLIGLLAAFALLRNLSLVAAGLQAPGPRLLLDFISSAGLLGLVLLAFDAGGIRARLPGFSSPNSTTVTVSFGLYIFTLLAVPGIVGAYVIKPPGDGGNPAAGGGGFVTAAQCIAPDCLYIDDAGNGRQYHLRAGGLVVIYIGATPSDLSSDPVLCDFHDSAPPPVVLEKQACAGGNNPGDPIQDRFRATRAGVAHLSLRSGQYRYQVDIVVDPG